MVPLSLNVAQLEVLVVIAGLLFFAFLFLAIFFSAIIGAVTARVLYVGGHWCVKKIQQSHSACNTRTVNVVGRLVPHHRTY
jgi:xanthine/uracil/vitamin C permease (AzgA family)